MSCIYLPLAARHRNTGWGGTKGKAENSRPLIGKKPIPGHPSQACWRFWRFCPIPWGTMTANRKQAKTGKRDLYFEEAQSLYLAGKTLAIGRKSGGRCWSPPGGWGRP